MAIKVAIADDHQLFRKLLSTYLSQHKDVDVALEASDALELFAKMNTTRVDVVLSDLYMPRMNGIDAATILRNEFPEVKIIIISLCTDINVIRTFLDIGIYAYLTKNEEPYNVLTAIKAAFEDRIYKNELFTQALYTNKEVEIKTGGRRSEININQREKQVIQLIWEEKSNKEISDIIYLSVSSIEKIKQELKERLNVRSLAGLIRYGLLNGIITLKQPLAPEMVQVLRT